MNGSCALKVLLKRKIVELSKNENLYLNAFQCISKVLMKCRIKISGIVLFNNFFSASTLVRGLLL